MGDDDAVGDTMATTSTQRRVVFRTRYWTNWGEHVVVCVDAARCGEDEDEEEEEECDDDDDDDDDDDEEDEDDDETRSGCGSSVPTSTSSTPVKSRTTTRTTRAVRGSGGGVGASGRGAGAGARGRGRRGRGRGGRRRCGRRFDPSKGIKMSCTHVGERVLEWRGECVLEGARGARITYRCVGYCVIF